MYLKCIPINWITEFSHFTEPTITVARCDVTQDGNLCIKLDYALGLLATAKRETRETRLKVPFTRRLRAKPLFRAVFCVRFLSIRDH